MNGKYRCLGLLTSLVSSLVFAEGIPIEPGKWEMTSTTKLPMLPQPRVNIKMQCLEGNELSPQTMSEKEMDPSCTMNSKMVDRDTMQWSMDCNEKTGASHGEWEVTSHGDTLTGAGTVTVDMGGHAMVMTMKWVGKRVGDCD